MRQVKISDITLNEPLPWDLRDANGNLLLRAGHVLSIEEHIEKLVARGAYAPDVVVETAEPEPSPPEPQPTRAAPVIEYDVRPLLTAKLVFVRAEALIMALKRLHTQLQSQTVSLDVRRIVRSLAHTIMQTCTDDPDALIAACHLDRHHSYLVVQQLLSSTVVEITAREMGMDEATRLSLLCAALTRDIAMLPVQLQLDHQTVPLDAQQKTMVRTHPEQAVRELTAFGIDDPLWLDFVRQHHERLNGSGYPHALQGDAISLGARLLGLADSYAAMVTPRPNRPAQLPKDVMKSLYAHRNTLYDADVLRTMVNALTTTPPGTVVRMACGEVGVIRSRPPKDGPLEVWVLYDRRGMPHMRIYRSDPEDPAYDITETLHVEDCRSSAVVMKRLWTKY